MSAEEVVVTQIFVASLIQHLLIGDHELNHGETIEYGDGDEVPLVQLRLLTQHPGTLARQVRDKQHGLSPEHNQSEISIKMIDQSEISIKMIDQSEIRFN